MELTKQDKLDIFYALLRLYPEYEKGRIQARYFFGNDEVKYKKTLENIEKAEKKSYALIKKIAEEIGKRIPEYKSTEIEWTKIRIAERRKI
jgi:hypothetical protein